jgi:hypothetical protein
MQFVPEGAHGTSSMHSYPIVADRRDYRVFVPHRDTAGA